MHPFTFWIALAALAAKEGMFRYMLAVATRVRSQMLVANAWHARSDAASSLVVLVGIGGNLLGYIFLDYMWMLFGTLMAIYLFIAFGFSMLLMDLVIAKPWARGGGGEEEGGHMTGKQYSEELAKRKAMRGRF